MPDLFKEKSSDWDKNELVQALSSAVGNAILARVSFERHMNVMDFGAGTGLISSHVSPMVNKIVAVDISAAMLEKLVAKPELHGKVEAVCQNIIEHPLEQKFDLIMSAMAIHHVEDVSRLIQCFAQHLKPDGTIALADLDKEDGSFHQEGTQGVYHFGFERYELKRILKQNGFGNVRFVTAHTVNKNDKDYSVFLVTATKYGDEGGVLD